MRGSIARITASWLVLAILTLLLAACGQTEQSNTGGQATATSGASGASDQPTATTSEDTADQPTATTEAQAEQTDLGTEDRPIRMYFVPSAEAAKVLESGDKIATALGERTGLKFETEVPTSYAAVIEAMGSGEADIAWLATFAYVMANEKYGVDVALTTTRRGEDFYRGEIIARADSGIKAMEDCNGKRVAWTDPASTSGYVYPSGLFAQKGIKPSEEIFAGGHPQAVLAVYEGNADCAATYYSPPAEDGTIQDGRQTILETHPDAAEALVIVGQTDKIPNDTVSFRKDFPADLREKLVSALLEYADSDEGKQVLTDLYNITGFVESDDTRYDIVRDTLRALGKNPEDFLQGK